MLTFMHQRFGWLPVWSATFHDLRASHHTCMDAEMEHFEWMIEKHWQIGCFSFLLEININSMVQHNFYTSVVRHTIHVLT